VQPNPWTIRELLKVATDYLQKKKIDAHRLTSEILLSHCLNIKRIDLYLDIDRPLNDSEVSAYRELIRRRINREPLEYITGIQEFWSLDFYVNKKVLIPRPETELLVEQTIDICNKAALKHSPRILDLGTGSGALAISLAKEIQDACIWATDISEGAIEVARLNAQKHVVSDRIDFRQGDLFQPFVGHGIAFDFIVSNPPYVSAGQYNALPPEVRDHEPRQALDGHEDGFYYIKNVIEESPGFLSQGGWLLVEMAPDQTEKALELIGSIKAFAENARIMDYSRRYRVVRARRVTV
jgi:release factor glutamine methyltransferase